MSSATNNALVPALGTVRGKLWPGYLISTASDDLFVIARML